MVKYFELTKIGRKGYLNFSFHIEIKFSFLSDSGLIDGIRYNILFTFPVNLS